MSIRLALILSNNCSNDTLSYFRTGYNIALIKKVNPEFCTKQLCVDEALFEATGNYDDSDTGIGSYKLYYRDISYLEKKFKDDPYAYKVVIEEFKEKRNEYLNSAKKWAQILNEMHHKIPKVGILYFGGYTTTELVKFPLYFRKYYNADKLTSEDLIGIQENEIAFIT